ncbi:sensor histidine kinase [Streptomyces sp. NPDC059766]|uniref:sensor histidine kinase n=1 Tax=Streptomyces sp. NPDC059766 TaxID=3346940 RepID=UPI003661AB00
MRNPLLQRLAPRTLRGRLSLVALTTAALLMTILTVVFNTVVRHHLRAQADDELRARAAAIATTVDTGGRTVRVLEASDDGLLDSNVWIYAGSTTVEQPPSPAPEIGRAAGLLAARADGKCTTVEGDRPVRLCARPVTHGRLAATVVTALDLSPYRSSADLLLLGSLALDAVMLACTYALTRLAVGRALRPVRAMSDQAIQWSAVESERRFGTVAQPAELARLGASLDSLLDRIRAVLRHERRLTGELSHELRTPLSRIVAELDWWRSRPRSQAETLAVHRRVTEAAESMRTICDTLLGDAREEARHDAATAPGTAEVLPVLRRLAAHQEDPARSMIVVTAADDRLEAGVSPALLERIVGPLLANALRYARSGVTVHVVHVGHTRPGHPLPGPGPARPAGPAVVHAVSAVRIDVTDDGPGVPEAFLGQLFQPGRRADPYDGHGGAGLGLPLARRLARSAGGEVHHDPAHTAGARFTVTLPAG